jgi:crossover junction endodeoxyribonuclease RuvC
MRFIGIDPGLRTIGIGVIEHHDSGALTALDWLVITTEGMDTPLRLQEIHNDLVPLLEQHRPEMAVVERVFFAVNEKTAIDVAQARGVILYTLAAQGIAIIEPTPLQIKAAITGDGRADKRQVQEMVSRILQLREVPTPVDAADALAMAVYGSLMTHIVISH